MALLQPVELEPRIVLSLPTPLLASSFGHGPLDPNQKEGAECKNSRVGTMVSVHPPSNVSGFYMLRRLDGASEGSRDERLFSVSMCWQKSSAPTYGGSSHSVMEPNTTAIHPKLSLTKLCV